MTEQVHPRSRHLPEVAGAIEEVTGSLVVDTQLREVQSFNVTLAAMSTATEAVVSAVMDPETRKMTIYVMAPDGVTPGVNPVKVAWLALGK